MSKIFPSIPDPSNNIQSLYDAVRTMKYSLELLTGQTGDIAAARVFVRPTVPDPQASGDLWIDTSRNNKLLMWDGVDWRTVTV